MAAKHLLARYQRTLRFFRVVSATCVAILSAAAAQAQVGNVTVLHSFGGTPEGDKPNSVLQATDGFFYGTTERGGDSNFGTVFQLAPTGELTTLHSIGQGVNDGAQPSHLVQATDGNFYNISQAAVYRTTPTGATSLIKKFETSQFSFDIYIYELIAGADGNLYGGYFDSGTPSGVGQGSLLTVTLPAQSSEAARSDGNLSTAKASIAPSPNGTTNYPGPTSLSQGSDGYIYYNQQFYFSADPSRVVQFEPAKSGVGGSSRTIYTFEDAENGFYPSPFVQGSDGNLYGTTQYGGTSGNGTVFRLTPAGVLTTLYPFKAAATDGATHSGLTQGSDGNFYGTSASGGANSDGNLFRVTPRGEFAVVHDFVAATEGSTPTGLVSSNDGNLYGTMSGGGVNDKGVLYRFDVVLSIPAVTSNTVAGRAGQVFSYRIAGTNTPTGYAAAGLPAGLVLDAASGVITGAPTQVGTFAVELSATNADGTGTGALSLTVGAALPVVTVTATVPSITAGGGEVGEFELGLSEAQDHDVFVNLTIKGSAVNGEDYALIKSVKKIKAGKTRKPVKIVPQGELGAEKKVVTLLIAPGDGYAVGTAGKVKVKIVAP